MIGATATTLRFQQISNSGPWWWIAQKFPASEFSFFTLIGTNEELEAGIFGGVFGHYLRMLL